MSRWTHVNGIIRIEALINHDLQDDYIIEDIKCCFGKTVNFLDPREEWNACTVPCGSEGSIQYTIIKTRKIKELSIIWGFISIYGDLRSYDDQTEIINWIKKSVSISNTWWVSSLCIKIDTDEKNSIIIHDIDDDRVEIINIGGI